MGILFCPRFEEGKASLGQVHQHLLHHYDARIRDDTVNGDYKEQRGAPTRDGRRHVASSASGGSDEDTRLTVLEKEDPDLRQLNGHGVRVNGDRSCKGRHSVEPPISGAVSRPRFEQITQGESSMRSKGLRGGGGDDWVAQQFG